MHAYTLQKKARKLTRSATRGDEMELEVSRSPCTISAIAKGEFATGRRGILTATKRWVVVCAAPTQTGKDN